MATEVKLPELAEGVEKGDVVNLMVKEGDILEIDTPILEVESEKATLTVPSRVAGRIEKLLIKKGDKIAVGQTILTIEGAGSQSDGKAAAASSDGQDKGGDKTRGEIEPQADTRPEDPVEDRLERHEEPDPATAKSEVKQSAPSGVKQGHGGTSTPPQKGSFLDDLIPAGPAVRRIARELGIDLHVVQGSGRNGRIVVEDLDPFIKGYVSQRGNGHGVITQGAAPAELPDFSKFGPIRRERTDSLRRKIADKMTQSWTTVPHVHQFADADITDLMALQKRHKDKVKESGGALTLTVFALKAVALALKEFPQFNVTFDPGRQEIVHKDYIHIGVAVDTPAGLIVPVIRDVNKKPILQLARELNELAQKTRDRKTSIDDLRGGTFTISNLGGIGGTHFTPIINAPEVAILGIGRSSKRPVFDETGQVVARDIAPICVGYDHRVIDGADGARFVVRLVDILENFEAAFLGF